MLAALKARPALVVMMIIVVDLERTSVFCLKLLRELVEEMSNSSTSSSKYQNTPMSIIANPYLPLLILFLTPFKFTWP
jgi:hypothetical protein